MLGERDAMAAQALGGEGFADVGGLLGHAQTVAIKASPEVCLSVAARPDEFHLHIN